MGMHGKIQLWGSIDLGVCVPNGRSLGFCSQGANCQRVVWSAEPPSGLCPNPLQLLSSHRIVGLRFTHDLGASGFPSPSRLGPQSLAGVSFAQAGNALAKVFTQILSMEPVLESKAKPAAGRRLPVVLTPE